MDAAHRKGSRAIDVGNAPFGGAAAPRQRETIGRARCERPYWNAAAANELAGAEADAFTLGQELPQRGTRRMVDDYLFGITNGEPRPCASLAEFIIASRLEALVETAHRIEHRAPHEQVGRGAEALLHIAALPEEPPGVDELGRRRRRGQFEMHATGDARDGRERGEAELYPVRPRDAIDVRESDVCGRRRVQAGIACCIRTQGTGMNQQPPAWQELFPKPGLSSVFRTVVDPDHLDSIARIFLRLERVDQRTELRARISERDDDRDRWRHSAFGSQQPEGPTEPFPRSQLPSI